MQLPPTSAARVTRRRADRRLSFRQAAKVSGLSVATWQRVEGQEPIALQTLVTVCKALGWPEDAPDRLLRGEDPNGAISDGGPCTVEAAIAADPRLDEVGRRILLGAYKQAVGD